MVLMAPGAPLEFQQRDVLSRLRAGRITAAAVLQP